MSTPRVQIGIPCPPTEGPSTELPFVIGVLADFSGRDESSEAKANGELPECSFRDVDPDCVDDFLSAVHPRLVLEVPDTLNRSGTTRVELSFERLADFRPDQVARQVPCLRSLLGCSDQALAAQLQPILHHPRFRALEETWLGLAYLAQSVVASTNPKPARTYIRAPDASNIASTAPPRIEIRVLDISKRQLARHLERYQDDLFERSILAKEIWDVPFLAVPPRPFGLLVGDYYFDHRPEDVHTLEHMAQIASVAHAPLAAGAAPRLLGLDTWQGLADRSRLDERFHSPEYAAWNALRQSEDGKSLCLSLPRFLGRSPYGGGNPVEGFRFSEDLGDDPAQVVPWANSAFAFAANIARSFLQHGWLTQIRGPECGGRVEHTALCPYRTPDGTLDFLGPAEVPISDAREHELANLGLNSLCNFRGRDYAAFFSAVSLYQPARFRGVEVAAEAKLARMLPPLLCSSRFMHYLQCIAHGLVGTGASRADVERLLQSWITQYVSSPSDWRRPLQEADVESREVPGRPGWYEILLYIRPGYQLGACAPALRLVSRFP